MNVYSDAELLTMGLIPQRTDIDEIISFSNWARKDELHNFIKAQTTPTPPTVTDMWRREKGTQVQTAVNCNICICIMNITAVLEGEGEEGADLNLPVERYLCREEMGMWAKKYLTASEGNLKSNKHLKQASGTDNYPITRYNDYVPKLVLDSVNKYKELYLNKYLPDNSTLTKGVMSATFVSFKCDYQMDEDGVIDKHV